MKQLYLIGDNGVSITVPDDLPVWSVLKDRYMTFATDRPIKPALEAEIRTGTVDLSGCELIYEPGHEDFAIINARALRHPDGRLVMEFKHIDQPFVREYMIMSPTFDRAEIVIASDSDVGDSYFVTHALMVAYMLATTGNGTLIVHSSTVLFDGKAYLFQGRSGTGKSTHASLWVKNIPGAELLNDDNPIIRFTEDGVAMAYGSPWSGKTHCYRNLSAPIGAMVRIVRSKDNELRRLAPLQAYASLTTTAAYLPFFTKEQRDTRHATIERLVGAVECCEMHCRPDADAALTCMKALTL